MSLENELSRLMDDNAGALSGGVPKMVDWGPEQLENPYTSAMAVALLEKQGLHSTVVPEDTSLPNPDVAFSLIVAGSYVVELRGYSYTMRRNDGSWECYGSNKFVNILKRLKDMVSD